MEVKKDILLIAGFVLLVGSLRLVSVINAILEARAYVSPSVIEVVCIRIATYLVGAMPLYGILFIYWGYRCKKAEKK